MDVSRKKYELFVKAMEQFQKENQYIPKGMEKNKQFLKDIILRNMKELFIAIDNNDEMKITQLTIEMATKIFLVGCGSGDILIYAKEELGII